MNSDAVRVLLIGPAVVLLLTAFLAASALLAGALGRLEGFTGVARRTANRLPHRRPVLLLWGLSAFLLFLLSAAILVNIKPLALLGIVFLGLGLSLAGLGMGVSAACWGRLLCAALGQPHAAPAAWLALGLTAFLLTACVPVLGWLLVAAAGFTGMGAVLDALYRQNAP